MTRTVLVIGATGILAPAADSLRAEGVDVVAVSRHPHPRSIALDARDGAALIARLAQWHWDDALVYGPATSVESRRALCSATPGRAVLMRPSADADPALGPLVVPRDTLQLGWTATVPHRWHTPEEVSAAALRVLADGEPRTLGTVRPWGDRP